MRPYLRQPKVSGDGYKALATCHDDHDPSLSVGVLGGRVTWKCWAKCSSDKARNAMILLGVPAGCLIRPAADLARDMDTVRAIVSGKESPAHKVLLVAAVLEGYAELPRGQALEALAEGCGLSGREAYKARRAGLHP